VRVRSLVKVGETLEVHAGTFTSETPLKPIQARHQARAGLAPGPVPSGISRWSSMPAVRFSAAFFSDGERSAAFKRRAQLLLYSRLLV